jgi:cadmium resistance protein CadD (predicted permease)
MKINIHRSRTDCSNSFSLEITNPILILIIFVTIVFVLLFAAFIIAENPAIVTTITGLLDKIPHIILIPYHHR